MIKRVESVLDGIKNELIELSDFILKNPELGYEEVKACNAHIQLLKKYGFEVEQEYMNIKTAFKGTFFSGKEGPTIAYLAEYDALPGIGHGCGHNILGATSTGAGIVLSKLIKDLGGKVIVYGTPAEETSGSKVYMANNGSFDGVDIVMMAHPADKYYKSGKSLAMEAIQFTFKGKAAHAAVCPEEGINALDAVINTFNNINALREHVESVCRIHGIIIKGGEAANVVPELAVAQFYVRAPSKKYLKELTEKVKNCAKGASLATGTQLEISNYEASYDNLITNKTLSKIYNNMLKAAGVENICEPRECDGSVDAGNVSQVCPLIHPYFSISDEEIVEHTKGFAEATNKPKAYEEMMKTVKALVLTGIEVIRNPEVLNEIKNEFENVEK